ncbi:MAG TPA: hypothetical protein VNK52_17240 [Hyphomicrobiaceae bacterium]|nr:hypothetical protein [Hyphomicrobiaceae bacterium]
MRAALSAAALLGLAFTGGAFAQEDSHARFHSYYQDWVNFAGDACCNSSDCRELAPEHERTDANGNLEVYVRGVGVAFGTAAWCKVLPRHYLRRGNAPNWASSHVCISTWYGGNTPCEQLVCYQPKPGG